MTDACTMPRQAITAAGEALRFQRIIKSLDLDGCQLRYIVMAMNEFEKAAGPSWQHWPIAIQVRMNKEIERFQKENPKAELRAVTEGVHDNACVLALHWKERA